MTKTASAPHDRDDWEAHWSDFDEAAHRNPAQLWRRRRLIELLSADARNMRLLDIGSGQGDFAAAIEKAFPEACILGLELSVVGVAQAAHKAPRSRFVQRDLMDGGAPPEDQRCWATHATCSEVLEHLNDPVAFLRSASAYMQPGCLLIVTVPAGPMSAFDRAIGHRRHFTDASLTDVLRQAGFDPQRVDRAGFPFHHLYRMLVLLRGRRLAADFRGGRSPRGLTRLSMRVFAWLFQWNCKSFLLGWQLMAVARWRGAER